MRLWRGPHTRASAPEYAPLAWSRAAAFGLVSGGIGVLGHDLLSHTPTRLSVLAIAVAFATLVARPLAPLRIGPRTMFVALIALQSTIHAACVATLDGHAAASGASAHMDMVMATGHITMAHPGGTLDLLASIGMILLHLGITALGGAVLLALEAHAWEFVRDSVLRFLRHVTPRTRRRLRTRIAAYRCVPPRPAYLNGSRFMRGPPAVRCIP